MDPIKPALVNNHRQDGLFAIGIVLIFLETLFFCLRIHCRRSRHVRWWADDYLVVISYVACIALDALGIALARDTQVGHHTSEVVAVDMGTAVLQMRLQFAVSMIYCFAIVLPKMAIVALFFRIFIQPKFRIACTAVGLFLMVYLVAIVVASFVGCRPLSEYWNPREQTAPGGDGGCINLNALYDAISIPNVITDVAIIILPIPMVWKLPKPLLEKLGLLATLCLGLLGLVFSLVRAVEFYLNFSQKDPLWGAPATIGVSLAEPASYFLVACMLTFRILLKDVSDYIGSMHAKLKERQRVELQEVFVRVPAHQPIQ